MTEEYEDVDKQYRKRMFELIPIENHEEFFKLYCAHLEEFMADLRRLQKLAQEQEHKFE